MNCFISTSKDPYVNLAAEEYLLHQTGGDFFMLWQSQAAVVVGKHQNTLAEISLRQALENSIHVARRLTGGGTVFHDPGNLNFSFIRNGEPGRLVSFSTQMKPIMSFLHKYGIPAEEGPHNEILVDNLKVSGNAEHIRGNRVLHHGTLLFDSDLELLEDVITRRQGGSYSHRGVRSNRMQVANLHRLLPADMGMKDFIHALHDHMKDYYKATPFAFTPLQEADIEKLAGEKYRSWDWIYGWSPDYAFSNEIRAGRLRMEFSMQVHRGRIVSFSCSSCGPGAFMGDRLSSVLTDIPHEPSAVEKVLKDLGFDHLVSREQWEHLVYGFF